jgi:hypothetical protein
MGQMALIDDFCRDGFLVARGAIAPDVVREWRHGHRERASHTWY